MFRLRKRDGCFERAVLVAVRQSFSALSAVPAAVQCVGHVDCVHQLVTDVLSNLSLECRTADVMYNGNTEIITQCTVASGVEQYFFAGQLQANHPKLRLMALIKRELDGTIRGCTSRSQGILSSAPTTPLLSMSVHNSNRDQCGILPTMFREDTSFIGRSTQRRTIRFSLV